MNTAQKQYLSGIIQWENAEVLTAIKAGAWGTFAYASLINNIEPIALLFPLSLWSAFNAGKQALYLGRLHKEIISRKEFIRSWTQFADSEEIIINDIQGLEMLLDRTACYEINEWGTALNVEEKKPKAIITEIKKPEDMVSAGFIEHTDEDSFTFNMQIFHHYDGIHHYHPGKICGKNFAVTFIDRNLPLDAINLLSFNMPYGPEIIGYNTRYTYIPAKREDKTRLIRARRRDIWRYLATK